MVAEWPERKLIRHAMAPATYATELEGPVTSTRVEHGH